MAKTITISKPNPKQELFLAAKKKYIGFGGARGGGKSWAVRTKAILISLNYPGIKVLIVRRTYPELIKNHINQLRIQLFGVAKYNDKDKVLKFGNGSTISFMYCARDQDLDHMQGDEYDIIFLDEATQLSETQMKKIMACLRGANDFPKRAYYTMNPGGQGHAYIKRLFIDKKYKEGEEGEDPEEYEFIQSLVTDNRILMKKQPDYIKQLQALPEKLRAGWLFGNWDIFDGQFFEDFIDRTTPMGEGEDRVEDPYKERRWTNVIDPFEIPKEWPIYRSFDFGYAKPFSCAWWTIDYDGRLYRILEMYGCTKDPNEGVKWVPEKIFKEIHTVETEHRWLKGKQIFGVADPSIWDASRGESVNDTATKYGVYFDKGDNERIPGWMQMHYRLAFDEEGYPMMYVFNNCKAFIRTVPLLQYSDTKPEDLETDGEDHVADECLVGDTMVWTDKGKIPIRELVGTSGMVYSDDGELHNYSDCRMTKKQADVFVVELEDGTKIKTTANHPFMLNSGEYVRLSDLSPGRNIKTISVS